MILTEEEAKTKWCPFARVVYDSDDRSDGASWNRFETASTPQGTLCIASACMAWRWGHKRNPDWRPAFSMMSPAGHPDDEARPYIRDDEHGFCGLAGGLS